MLPTKSQNITYEEHYETELWTAQAMAYWCAKMGYEFDWILQSTQIC